MQDLEVAKADKFTAITQGIQSLIAHNELSEIEEIVTKGPIQVISICIPLSRTFGFATQLRSETQGRASYTMTLSHYAEAK